MSVPLDSILRAHPERVLIVFNARCSTCVGEAQVWQRIERERPHAVVALAFTPDQEFLRSFRERARVTFEVWRCDEAVIKALGLAGLPSIFVLADNRVLFSKYGPEATIGLEGWIARRTGLHDESSVG